MPLCAFPQLYSLTHDLGGLLAARSPISFPGSPECRKKRAKLLLVWHVKSIVTAAASVQYQGILGLLLAIVIF